MRAMVVSTAKLTRKWQITIPSAVRRELGLHEGDSVFLRIEGDRVVLQALPHGWTEASRGLGAEVWRKAGGTQAVHKERDSWDER